MLSNIYVIFLIILSINILNIASYIVHQQVRIVGAVQCLFRISHGYNWLLKVECIVQPRATIRR